jgi:hypothetical protein
MFRLRKREEVQEYRQSNANIDPTTIITAYLRLLAEKRPYWVGAVRGKIPAWVELISWTDRNAFG